MRALTLRAATLAAASSLLIATAAAQAIDDLPPGTASSLAADPLFTRAERIALCVRQCASVPPAPRDPHAFTARDVPRLLALLARADERSCWSGALGALADVLDEDELPTLLALLDIVEADPASEASDFGSNRPRPLDVMFALYRFAARFPASPSLTRFAMAAAEPAWWRRHRRARALIEQAAPIAADHRAEWDDFHLSRHAITLLRTLTPSPAIDRRLAELAAMPDLPAYLRKLATRSGAPIGE